MLWDASSNQLSHIHHNIFFRVNTYVLLYFQLVNILFYYNNQSGMHVSRYIAPVFNCMSVLFIFTTYVQYKLYQVIHLYHMADLST
jgi:hypothetical protein